eukprot:scaffold1951_cov258-Pinguiococcus_pyrenoidosus.AAC.32
MASNAMEESTAGEEPLTKEEQTPQFKKKSPLQVQFGPIHANNANMFRALNMAVFPVRYNEKFYQDVPLFPREYTMYGRRPLGAFGLRAASPNVATTQVCVVRGVCRWSDLLSPGEQR